MGMREMLLFNHQKQLLTKNPKRHLISFGTGTGKTLTAILLANKNCQSVLVICPKAIKQNWRRNLIEYAREDLIWSILTKEEFKSMWDQIIGYDGIIIDEAHYFANLKSQLSKCFIKYCKKHNPSFRWLLTATPYLSTPNNIFALATHLGYKWNWLVFDRKFFTRIPMGGRMIPKIKKGIENDIAKLVNTIGSTAKLEDLIDLPDQVFETEYFALKPEQTKAISELQETNYITRWTKIHTIENGIYIGNDYEEDIIYPSDKTERIKELCKENQKIIIFARYNGQLAHLEGVLSDLNRPIFVINGKTPDKDVMVQEAERAESAIVLINSMASEGYQLPSFRVMIFASLSFSFKDWKQSIGRNNRIDNPQRNVYITLVVKGGTDEDVFKAIEKKEDFHIAIQDYEKRS